MMWRSSKSYPLAYCPPGRGFSLGSNPRALPSVTHSSALQAPERQRESCDLTTHPHRTDVSHSALLSRGQHHHKMSHIALCCLEGSIMSNLVHRRRRCARIDTYMVLLPGGQHARGQGRFILVYRLAMDARPWRGDDVAG